MPAQHFSTSNLKAKVAIFEPFEGSFQLDFNLTEYVSRDGWRNVERIPGSGLKIEGSYRLVHTAYHVDPPALPEPD